MECFENTVKQVAEGLINKKKTKNYHVLKI